MCVHFPGGCSSFLPLRQAHDKSIPENWKLWNGRDLPQPVGLLMAQPRWGWLAAQDSFRKMKSHDWDSPLLLPSTAQNWVWRLALTHFAEKEREMLRNCLLVVNSREVIRPGNKALPAPLHSQGVSSAWPSNSTVPLALCSRSCGCNAVRVMFGDVY